MTEAIGEAAAKPKTKRRAKRKRGRGRPSIYSNALATEICYRIRSGKSLRAVCKAKNIPNRSTVLRWMESHKEFAERYGRAMEQRAFMLFDEVLDIADDASRDYMRTTSGKWVPDLEHIQRSRLRVAARQWCFSGMRARKYGDAGRQQASVPDGASGEMVIRWANSEAEATPDPAEKTR